MVAMVGGLTVAKGGENGVVAMVGDVVVAMVEDMVFSLGGEDEVVL